MMARITGYGLHMMNMIWICVDDDAYIFNQSKSTRFEILYLVIENITDYVREKKITKDGISHTTVRDILRQYRIEWRHSKNVLDSSNKSRDTEYELKKAD
jgi:hypothetical protein